MCRMFVMLGRSEAVDRVRGSLVESLVEAARRDPYGGILFGNKEMSHGDGWGWALIYLDDQRSALYLGRSTLPIYKDLSINAPRSVFISPGGRSVLMVHARAASRGMPINIFSTHPVEALTSKGYRLFLIHNGSVDKEELLKILGIDAGSDIAKIYNDTYFLAQYMAKMILEEIDDKILSEAARLTRTALNIGMVLVKGQEAWVAAGSLYKASERYEEKKNYYKIYKGETEDLVIYSSSTLVDFYKPSINIEWKELPNGHFEIYRIDGKAIEPTRQVTIEI